MRFTTDTPAKMVKFAAVLREGAVSPMLAPVVNEHENAKLIGFPDRSCTPVVTVSV